MDFARFTKKFGRPAAQEKVTKKQLAAYARRLPPECLELWQRFGFASFRDGLLWTVNPSELDGPLGEWVPRAKGKANPIALLRTAWAKVIYFHDDRFWLLDPILGHRFEAGDAALLVFEYMLVDKNADIGILRKRDFDKALKKLGPLAKDETYGYGLPIGMGGADSVKNMAKLKLREHLSLLAQARG